MYKAIENINGFRQLDPQLGRWHVTDAMAESYMSTSPYAYVMNNPISHIDVMGLYRGGGRSWLSYPKPYLDSNSSRHGGGMFYQNNMPGSLAGLNTTRMPEYGPTAEDIQDYNSLPESIRKNMSLGQWWGKQLFALAGTGLTRQEALANHYTFSSHQVKKWRRKYETLSYTYSGFSKEEDIEISEVIVIEEAYYETEYDLYPLSNYSGSGNGYRYKGIRLDYEETKQFLKEWNNFITNTGYSSTLASTPVGVIKFIPSGVAAFNSLNIASEYFIKQKLLNEVSDNYDNNLVYLLKLG